MNNFNLIEGAYYSNGIDIFYVKKKLANNRINIKKGYILKNNKGIKITLYDDIFKRKIFIDEEQTFIKDNEIILLKCINNSLVYKLIDNNEIIDIVNISFLD